MKNVDIRSGISENRLSLFQLDILIMSKNGSKKVETVTKSEVKMGPDEQSHQYPDDECDDYMRGDEDDTGKRSAIGKSAGGAFNSNPNYSAHDDEEDDNMWNGDTYASATNKSDQDSRIDTSAVKNQASNNKRRKRKSFFFMDQERGVSSTGQRPSVTNSDNVEHQGRHITPYSMINNAVINFVNQIIEQEEFLRNTNANTELISDRRFNVRNHLLQLLKGTLTLSATGDNGHHLERMNEVIQSYEEVRGEILLARELLENIPPKDKDLARRVQAATFTVDYTAESSHRNLLEGLANVVLAAFNGIRNISYQSDEATDIAAEISKVKTANTHFKSQNYNARSLGGHLYNIFDCPPGIDQGTLDFYMARHVFLLTLCYPDTAEHSNSIITSFATKLVQGQQHTEMTSESNKRIGALCKGITERLEEMQGKLAENTTTIDQTPSKKTKHEAEVELSVGNNEYNHGTEEAFANIPRSEVVQSTSSSSSTVSVPSKKPVSKMHSSLKPLNTPGKGQKET